MSIVDPQGGLTAGDSMDGATQPVSGASTQAVYGGRRSGRIKRASPLVPAVKFLLPNLIGFLAFTLFPVLFAFWMAFTNWTLKPAVTFHYVWLGNFTSLLGVRPIKDGQPLLLIFFVTMCVLVIAGIVALLWANMAGWRGLRIGGAITLALGLGFVAMGIWYGGGQGAFLAGLITILSGAAILTRDDSDWRLGWGTAPALALLVGVAGLAISVSPTLRAYTPTDAEFWQYLYNTIYLMVGIPISIAGALGLALLVHEELPTGDARGRVIACAICVAAGVATLALIWSLGNPNAGLIGAIMWWIVALAFAFNVTAFRTLFYIPTFTAGVALMILWKALYNPETGPVNVILVAIFHALHIHAQAPQWLADVSWAKPALIIMGVWTSIGGTNMLLYLAGLTNVPKELLDAASVDGANGWARFKHVIWPQLAPTTFLISVMSIIGGLQGGFDQAQVMTAGGPAGSTTTLAYYIYEKAFQDLQLGYASAISWVLFALVFGATILNWKFGKGLEVER